MEQLKGVKRARACYRLVAVLFASWRLQQADAACARRVGRW